VGEGALVAEGSGIGEIAVGVTMLGAEHAVSNARHTTAM
jgi:hypothetical protein